MKSTLFEDFDERAQEVSKYFLFLKNMDKSLIDSGKDKKDEKIKDIDTELLKTLKATGYLLLYNLVESTMTNGIKAIHENIIDNNASFDNLRDELRVIIIKSFNKNKSTEKISQRIQDISVDIVPEGLNNNKIFSGNVDNKLIQELSKRYGFSAQTHEKTRDGNDLINIKNHRNDLAHGSQSFKEIGRNTTADELLEIQKRVVYYLREILQNIETCISKQEYLK